LAASDGRGPSQRRHNFSADLALRQNGSHLTDANGEAPWGVTEERASESDVFAHDTEGKLTFMRASSPRQIRTEEIDGLVNEFALAFKNAKRAGFDGVEIHAANGYLFDQFLNSALNTRTDPYGGATPQTRTHLLLEVVDAAIIELGADKVGVRLSPFGDTTACPSIPMLKRPCCIWLQS
jgi:N-ethylmaleimide reductase